MLVASAWAYFLLPETKGLTIDQMDYVLYVTSLSLLIYRYWLSSSCSGYKTDAPYMIPHTSRTTKEVPTLIEDTQIEKVVSVW